MTVSRTQDVVTGSDNFNDTYRFGDPPGGGVFPLVFTMKLSEFYSIMSYSLPLAPGSTLYYGLDKTRLSFYIPDLSLWDGIGLQVSAAHSWKTSSGGSFTFGALSPPDDPYMTPDNWDMKEGIWNTWIPIAQYGSISYGVADLTVFIVTASGLKGPVPWPNLLQDNDVEAPDQIGQ
jgi:hypothetical protein